MGKLFSLFWITEPVWFEYLWLVSWAGCLFMPRLMMNVEAAKAKYRWGYNIDNDDDDGDALMAMHADAADRLWTVD